MKVGIVFDTWKCPIFALYLGKANITYVVATDAPKGTIGFIIETDNPDYVRDIIAAANSACKTAKAARN